MFSIPRLSIEVRSFTVYTHLFRFGVSTPLWLSSLWLLWLVRELGRSPFWDPPADGRPVFASRRTGLFSSFSKYIRRESRYGSRSRVMDTVDILSLLLYGLGLVDVNALWGFLELVVCFFGFNNEVYGLIPNELAYCSWPALIDVTCCSDWLTGYVRHSY